MRTDRSPFRPTRREIEVLQLICSGYTTKEIAAHLRISMKTAMCHRSRLVSKAEARTPVQLYPWALRQGYLTIQSEPKFAFPSTETARQDPAPTDTKAQTESQLLANAEYARVQYEMFRAKIKATPATRENPRSQRARRLAAATHQARLIYNAASRAASTFIARTNGQFCIRPIQSMASVDSHQ